MRKILSQSEYLCIEQSIENVSGNTREVEHVLANTFRIPVETIASIIRNHIVRKAKVNHFEMYKSAGKLMAMYLDSVHKCEPEGILIRLAEMFSYSPAIVAKVILEQYLEQQENNSSAEQLPTSLNNPKNKVSKLMVTNLLKDTTLIEDPRLAREVFLCSLYDNQYGYIPEIIRRYVGEEYEEKLEYFAKKAGLSFWTEDQLRKKGYDKTPDIQLTIPVAVGGVVINWIESKGTFGDPYVHRGYINEQYLSYWNRFGPGLVIYWLGYVETCANSEEIKFIIRDDFPQDVTHLQGLNSNLECNKTV